MLFKLDGDLLKQMEIYREDRGQKLDDGNIWKHLEINGDTLKQIEIDSSYHCQSRTIISLR
ncbi:hypothetical protein DMA11_18770 [Marinilabiliaceae bacterium JC017]|nr:hypothetical protein DMA11_18770 [Marinilabiliaceae bacterium JC017]